MTDVSFVDPPKQRTLACPACGSAFIRQRCVTVEDSAVEIGFECEACLHRNTLELRWDIGTRVAWMRAARPHGKSNWQCRYDDIPRIVEATRIKINGG